VKIVITGSSSGIGHALAARLVARGHEVWGLARTLPSGGSPSGPGSLRSSACDVSQWAAVAHAAAEVMAAWGVVDALVTCAGIQGEVGRALTAKPEEWSRTIRTNLDGTYYALRAFHPLLAAASRRAKIVCFSGGGATKPRARFSAYGAAKTAVVRLVETIAEEEAASNLDINALAPGAINTRLTDEVIALGPALAGQAEFDAAVKQKQTGGASLQTALDAVEWLLGPESDGVSGRLLSAPWDPWRVLGAQAAHLRNGDVYTLRRILPEERGFKW